MRRAHDIPPLVKAANLARWFLPWTVTREQWSSMSRSAVSGIAVNTLLLSRIGVPLFHRYRFVNRSGTHGAFRGPYMLCMLFWNSRMRRRYVGVIVDALGILRHGCRGHLFGTRKVFLLDPKSLVGQFPGPGGLPIRWRWPVLHWPRERFALIVLKRTLYKL